MCLSVSTVSRALANDKNIRKETRERIFSVACEMGYSRNIVAANLRTGRSHTIGVMVDQMMSPYAAKVLKGINGVMRDSGLYVVTMDADNDPELERDYIRMIEHSLFDGLIVAHCQNEANLGAFQRLHNNGMPMVFLRSSLDGIDEPTVGVNNYDKSFYLVDHLVRDGRKRVLYVKGPSLSNEMRELDRAYADVMRKHGLEMRPELQVVGGTDVESGKSIIDTLMDGGIEFDAVFAMNELVALGIMNRLMGRGVKIPEEVSVATFCTSPLSEMVHPQLTGVELPLEEMGREAAELLMRRIGEPNRKHPGVMIEAEIRHRGSSRIMATA